MLSEEALEKLSERLVDRIEELNLFMIQKIADQIVHVDTLTPTQMMQIFQSLKYGNDIDEIVNKVAEITELNVQDIYSIFEEVAKKNQEFAKKFYEYRNIKFIPFEKNLTLQNHVRAIAKATVNEYINISNTMAFVQFNEQGVKEFVPIADMYQKITDNAILSTAQGRESYQIAMRKAMHELSSNGIRTVDYASGYSRRMDSSVRMNVMDGIRRINRELQKEFGKEFGADGIEVSHHMYPAPDHEDTIDGRQFSIKGDVTVKGIKYEDFNTINDSLLRHVGELNCYHFIYPIILGVSEPIYSKEQLEADKKKNHDGFEFEGNHYTMYEGTQLQRQIETKIRRYKDRQIADKAINYIDGIYYCQEKIEQLMQKYNDLSKISGLPTKIDRLRVEGYTKIKVDKSNYKDITQEWLDKATPNSHKVLDRNYFEYKGVKYELDGKNVVLDYSNKEKDIAEWLENTFGGEIYMIPRVNKPDGIKTADYLFRNEYWDLKEIKSDGKKVIDNRVNGLKGQTRNFIFDISNNLLSDDEIINQIERMYKSPKRDWVDKVILIRDKNLLKIYKRNKKD